MNGADDSHDHALLHNITKLHLFVIVFWIKGGLAAEIMDCAIKLTLQWTLQHCSIIGNFCVTQVLISLLLMIYDVIITQEYQ